MSLLIIRGFRGACVVQVEDSSFIVSYIKNMIWIGLHISCFSKGCVVPYFLRLVILLNTYTVPIFS
jgi:hypothetical protein